MPWSNQKKKRSKQLAEPDSTRESLRKSITSIKMQAEAALSTLAAMDLTQCIPRSTHFVRSKNSTDIGDVDSATEVPISFREASEMIPTRPSASTISRWCTVGCRGVKLESTFFGGRRKTTPGAVDRFLSKCRDQGFVGMADAYLLEKAMAAKEQVPLERHDQ
jgi:hypothetical protein